MESELALRSVRAFEQIQIPHTLDDVFSGRGTTDFVDSLDWLSSTVKNRTADGEHGDIRYTINSVTAFSKWLVSFDDYAVKNDWGYHWNGNYWERMAVKQVYNMIDVAIMTIADLLHLAMNKKRELQRDIKPYLIERSRDFDDTVKPNYIAFKGWTLNVTTNGFFPPEKNMNIIGGFDFAPDPDKIPDTWIAYSQYIFGDNARFFWAWMGYAFQNDMNWKQGALFLLDPIGGTGKTYFVTKLTQALFGSQRVGAFKLKNIQGDKARFETARFVDKSLMIDDDASRARIKEDDTFKSVTGGGLSPIERKGIDGSEYKITAKMIINVNEMPIFNNAGAIKRRLHIIKTVAPFVDADEEKRRDELFPEEKLQDEIPSLATYAIEMYQKAKKEDWQIVGNIVDDIVATDPFVEWFGNLQQGTYKASELYDKFVEYYVSLDISKDNDPMSTTAFGRKMANYANKKRLKEGAVYEVKGG